MEKKYLVQLSASERAQLTGLIRKGKAAAYRRTHAQILLQVDEGKALIQARTSVLQSAGSSR